MYTGVEFKTDKELVSSSEKFLDSLHNVIFYACVKILEEKHITHEEQEVGYDVTMKFDDLSHNVIALQNVIDDYDVLNSFNDYMLNYLLTYDMKHFLKYLEFMDNEDLKEIRKKCDDVLDGDGL